MCAWPTFESQIVGLNSIETATRCTLDWWHCSSGASVFPTPTCYCWAETKKTERSTKHLLPFLWVFLYSAARQVTLKSVDVQATSEVSTEASWAVSFFLFFSLRDKKGMPMKVERPDMGH